MGRKYLAARPRAMEAASGPVEPRPGTPRSRDMPRHLAVLVLALASAPASRAVAQDDPVLASRAAYQEAVRAYGAHDTSAFLRFARQAQRLRPTHGAAIYNLACAYAMTGDTAGDSDLAPLRGAPGFDRVRLAVARNAAPLARARAAFTLPERDLLTE